MRGVEAKRALARQCKKKNPYLCEKGVYLANDPSQLSCFGSGARVRLHGTDTKQIPERGKKIGTQKAHQKSLNKWQQDPRGCGGDERVGGSLVSGGARCKDQCMQTCTQRKATPER